MMAGKDFALLIIERNGDNPGLTADDGLSTGGDSANPLAEEVEIEDGSSPAAAVWQTPGAGKDALGLPDLKLQSLPDFLKSAELPKLTKDERSAIVSQALLQLDHVEFLHFVAFLSGRLSRGGPIGAARRRKWRCPRSQCPLPASNSSPWPRTAPRPRRRRCTDGR
jgi:hypothetical protein